MRRATFHWAGLAAVLAGALGCDGAQVCGPGRPFALCGTVDGESVYPYTPASGVQLEGRGVASVSYTVIGLDGVFLDIWGDGEAWTDTNPHPVAGWLLEPPVGFVDNQAWICGASGTITHNADDSVDATLGAMSIIPRCNGGGVNSLQVDVFGGVVPFMEVPGCWIDFSNNGTRVVIISPTCPQTGVPMALDGRRVVMGQMPDTTACIGTGASLTLLADTSPTGGQHLMIDIPSMSAPVGCGPSTDAGDHLEMHAVGVP